jgi:hypothetical protein
MFVTLGGLGSDERSLRITWNLIAGSNHGRLIPCGAAIALTKKLLSATAPPPTGAMPCVGLLTVEEYLEPLRDLDIRESLIE